MTKQVTAKKGYRHVWAGSSFSKTLGKTLTIRSSVGESTNIKEHVITRGQVWGKLLPFKSGYGRYASAPGIFLIYREFFSKLNFFDFFFEKNESLVEDPQYRRPELTVRKLHGEK